MTWINKTEDCMLCDMEKRTEWYEETEKFVVAEKLGGGPFVVIKDHVKDPEDEEIEQAHEVVNDIFGDHEFRVLMNIVTDHWHAHIVTKNKDQNLKGE